MRKVLGWFVRRVDVTGPSMLPTLVPGASTLAVRKWRRVRVGDLVVVADPRDAERLLVKRCVARRWGQLDVRGDNPEFSTDSRDFGLIRARDVHWLIVPDRHAKKS
jgi:nickel-type superoxide dismutase maturation protease